MHPDRKHIYDAVLTKMVVQALQEKETQFADQHEQDTDAQLIAYLRQCAAELSHTPHPKEIVGWQFISERFGTWENALQKARLPRPYTPNTPSKFQRIIEETQLQQELYRQKKAQKKQKHQQRLQQQAQKRKEHAQETACSEVT